MEKTQLVDLAYILIHMNFFTFDVTVDPARLWGEEVSQQEMASGSPVD